MSASDRKGIAAVLDGYHAAINELSSSDERSAARALSYTSPTFTIRFGDVPLEVAGSSMIESVAAENHTRWKTSVRDHYWIIDESTMTAAGRFTEELRHPVTGELLRVVDMFTHVWLIDGPDGPLLDREHMVEVPAMYRTDEPVHMGGDDRERV